MPSFVGSQLHFDRPLANFATEYSNHELIGLSLCPEVMVEKKSDKFFKRAKENSVRYQNPKIGHLQVPPEIEQEVSTDSFVCEDYGFMGKLALDSEANADPPLSLRQDMAADLAARLRLAQEVRIATLLTTSGSYDSGNVQTLTGSDRWDSSGGGDPLAVIDTARASVWPGPRTKLVAFCGIDVWLKLKRHPQILDLVKGGATTSDAAIVSKQKFAELIEVDEFVVGEARQIATNPGQTSASTRVWGKYFGIVRVSMGQPSTRTLHFASSFAFGGLNMQTWIEQAPGLMGAYLAKLTHSTDEKVCVNDAGALVVSPIS